MKTGTQKENEVQRLLQCKPTYLDSHISERDRTKGYDILPRIYSYKMIRAV